MRTHRRTPVSFRIAILGLLVSLIAGCGAWMRQQHTATSVVDYLYPGQTDPTVQQGVPVLNLPMRVGLAFVPERNGQGVAALTAPRKMQLLERVAENFRKQDYIKSIEIIPSEYLVPRGGFTNLDQVRTMYGVETVALVSYDQAQFSDETMASLAYWTIVGVYVVPAQKNSTSTMVDAVVMHVPSRRMLFRAPGTSQIKGRSTPVDQAAELRADSDRGLDEAVDRMIANLDVQLTAFQEKVKASPGDYEVMRSDGSRGGGALDLVTGSILAMVLAGGAAWARRRN